MKDWAVILGASSGFGAATSRELASRGINIYGVHLDRKAGMEAVHALVEDLKKFNVEVRFNNMSATDAEKRSAVIDELKELKNARVKILMHSLAFGALKPVIDTESSNTLAQRQVEMTLDVMASSLLYWTQDLFQAELLQKGSQIFAMTSSGGHRQWKSYGAVSAAKASLESYCRQLALELSEYGIAANALQAGVTDTPALRKIPGNDQMIEHAIKMNPGKRLTVPEDVAKSIALLGLSEESWLTGNTIRIDGGEDITG
ncbi:MAG: SDR family oxidoreductase [Candidatus Marinimicrobia bacterium]|nr:SDR family oxidoreductase [Candidatus Neomarinimicrobiota bacterium]MDP6852884.1 SDR family oxidoreductase [Candidatus Neomarinimicrobiota bacterium]MDP6936465.1 SDR family oxidoreductase [Candidatus Neomarinimicrobiota bacterium]